MSGLAAIVRAFLQVSAIKVMRVEPGDVLVLRIRGHLSEEAQAHLSEQMQAGFPGLRCVVLDDMADLDVVRASCEL